MNPGSLKYPMTLHILAIVCVMAAGSFSLETCMIPVTVTGTSTRREAMAATWCKQNTFLYWVGLTYLTERQ